MTLNISAKPHIKSKAKSKPKPQLMICVSEEVNNNDKRNLTVHHFA